MDSTGFHLDQAALTGVSSISFGKLLEVENPELTVTNLDYSTTDSKLTADSIALTADRSSSSPARPPSPRRSPASRPPTTSPARGSTSARSATLEFSDFLQVTATKVSFSDTLNDPSQYSLTFDSAVLASPRLSGLSATLDGFKMDSSGFTLDQADLKGSFRLGSLVQADNVDLSVTNLVIRPPTARCPPTRSS